MHHYIEANHKQTNGLFRIGFTKGENNHGSLRLPRVKQMTEHESKTRNQKWKQLQNNLARKEITDELMWAC